MGAFSTTEQFLIELCRDLTKCFGFIFTEMNLEPTWSTSADCGEIAILYDMNESGRSEYAPLVEIKFTKNQFNDPDKRADAAQKIKQEIEQCVEKMYGKYTFAMASYYGYLCGNFQAAKEGKIAPPDPEQFLCRKVVTLN